VLLATPKHFAGYGFAEGGRDYNTVELTERTLWDVVLPPFEAAVRAGAATLMAAFNEVGGTPAHASRFLLQDVLRDRWRFGGLVVSDWTGVAELIPHGLGDSATVAARALAAGVDVEMSSTLYRTRWRAGARRARPAGRRRLGGGARAARQVGARAVRRPVPLQRQRARAARTLLRAEHRAAARAVAREAIVLLENRAARPGAPPALPLRKRPALGGRDRPARRRRQVGARQLVGRRAPEDAVTPLAGLRRALPNARVTHARGAPADTADTRASPQAAPPRATPTRWCSCSASGRT
jgi:beta-glucosidase